MAIRIRPSSNPGIEVDITRALTAALAHQLWQHAGGNEVLNWLEAERLVGMLEAGPRKSARAAPGWTARGRRAAAPAERKRPSAAGEAERVTGPLPAIAPLPAGVAARARP